MSRLIKCDRCGYAVEVTSRSAANACVLQRAIGHGTPSREHAADLCADCWDAVVKVFTEVLPR